MGRLNSPNKESDIPAANELPTSTAVEDTGSATGAAAKVPAWKQYLDRMGSGMGQPSSQKPSWSTMGAGITNALVKKFRPSED